MDTKNEILLLLTDKWCDWEASYAIAVANSFSDYIVKTIAIDKLYSRISPDMCIMVLE